MPNYVKNIMILRGDKERKALCIKGLEGTTQEDGVTYECVMDFNKIIPMPKTVENTVECGLTDMSMKIYRLSKEGMNPTEILENLKNDVEYGFSIDFKKSKEELESFIQGCIAQGEILVSNEETYGYATWYRWANANWRTKWNAIDSCVVCAGNGIVWQTAWCGVPNLIAKYSENYPDIEFIYAYANEDRAGRTHRLMLINKGNIKKDFFPHNTPMEPDACEDFANKVWEEDYDYLIKLLDSYEEPASSLPLEFDEEKLMAAELKMNSNGIFGYLTLYIGITYTDDTFNVISVKCDFSKPVTEEALFDIAKDVMIASSKMYKKMPKDVRFLSEEAYNNIQEFNSKEDSITFEFDENGVRISEEE